MMLLFLIGLSALWCAAGFQLCTARHRQRGMEVDHFWDQPTDLLPDGSPIVVPDDPRQLIDA